MPRHFNCEKTCFINKNDAWYTDVNNYHKKAKLHVLNSFTN